MQTSPEEMLQKVKRYTSDIFGQLPVKKIAKGTNFCYTIGDPPSHFLKIEPYAAKEQVEVLGMYRQAGIPVPEVVKLDESTKEFDSPIIILQYVPHDAKERITDYDLGSLLKRLHLIKVPGIGKMKNGRGESGSWEEFLKNYTNQRAKEYKELGIDPSAQLDEIKDLPTMNNFLHGDLNKDNVLISNGQIAAVIDPHGIVGDPMFDIASITYDPSDQNMMKELERGYSKEGLSLDDKRRLGVYQRLVRLQKVGFLTKKLKSANLSDDRRASYMARRKSYLENLVA